MKAATRCLAMAIGMAVAAVALAGAATNSPASRAASLHRQHDEKMQWFRRHPSVRLDGRRNRPFGSTAVIGLQSMQDLKALRTAYGFAQVRAIPALRAAEVRIDAAHLRALLRGAAADHRIR